MAAFHIATAGDGDGDKPNPMEQMSQMFGPGHVDQSVRQAISICWMALPPDRRNVAEVEKEIRRLFERALSDLRDDHNAFTRPITG